MTIKEAIAAKVQCPVSNDTIDVVIIDRGLDGSATYTASDKEGVERAVIDILYMIYTQPDITEGGYHLTHSNFLEKIKARLIQLATATGATDILALVETPAPTVTGRSVW